jgi:hypothetical protein
MIARALAHHPDLMAFHEPRPHMNAEAFARWRGSRNTDRVRKSIKGKRSTSIEQAKWNRCCYVESSHFCSHLIPELRELFGARFVHLYRDGRTFLRSGLERQWYPSQKGRYALTVGFLKRWVRRALLLDVGHAWEDHRLVPPRHLKKREEKIAWLWTEINDTILDHFSALPACATTSIKLESFSPGELEKLFQFIGNPAESNILEAAMETASCKPNRTRERSTLPFEAWEEDRQRRFWEIAGPMMANWNTADSRFLLRVQHRRIE